MRIVVALGGNALLHRGEHPDAAIQQAHIVAAARSLAELTQHHHEVIITHGNGPQIGLLALESATDPALAAPYPLDVLGAQTQGMIGSLLALALGDALPDQPIAALVSHTEVDPQDPAFARPTKFIGQSYSRLEAQRLATANGWTVAPDGDIWRRTVASPRPVAVVQAPVIRQLVDAGTLVICAGGGGVPVARDPRTGRSRGVEAVIDKDLTAALLAEELRADALLILTDVTHVFADYGTPRQLPVLDATPTQLRALDLPDGSMRPKAEAAASFVERTGGFAAIGTLESALDALKGHTGTTVRAQESERTQALMGLNGHPATSAHP